MIDECLEVFRKLYEREGEKLIINKHIPKDGTYILVDIKSGKILEKLDIFYNKKTKEIEGFLNQNYEYFRAYDYYSNLVDMNKPMDSKKIIHSNQIYSFFVKKDSIREKKLNKTIIEGYKKNILNPEEKYNSKEGKELYRNVAKDLVEIDNLLAEDIFLWLEDNVNENLLEDNKKDYLKIFFVIENFDKTLELFKNEHKRYIIPNIYNSNDYNRKVGENIYGLSNNNMGLNSKKMYLENKTRKISTPYLVDTKEILLQYAFYNYLLSEAKVGNNFMYFTDNKIEARTYLDPVPANAKYLLNITYGKDVEIKNFNVISNENEKEIKIHFGEFLSKREDKDKIEYGNLDRNKLLNNINKIFFFNFLLGNFLNTDGDLDIKYIEIKNLIIKYRNSFYKWFYLKDESEIKKNIRKLYLDAVKISIKNSWFNKAKQQFDLGFCLEKNFYGKSELMEEIMEAKEVFKNHILGEDDWNCLDDNEYFFALGQLLAYVNNMRNSKNKNLSFIKQLTSIKKAELIKEKVKNMILSYSHIFESKNRRIYRTISSISLYEPKEIKINMLLAGFTADIIFFKKKEEK